MNGIISVFATMGGTGAKYLCFFKAYVPSAPIKVARLPKITSHTAQPEKMFPSRQPTKRPGIAAGVKAGRTVNASEKRS